MVEVNPGIFAELYPENNVIALQNYLTVAGDSVNPLIDVVFDGRYIQDGDVVSPSPLITMRLLDENTFFLKQDTIGFDVFLKNPCETCEFERINFSSDEMTWTPSTDSTGFIVNYHPKMLPDSLYTLQVRAADASGNLSGTEPYSIRFFVVNESTITRFFPSPNPFSTTTRFSFSLTGASTPEDIKITIMTPAGKIVRTITQEEIGPIRAGDNLTEFEWDGTNHTGARLPNGVYFYHVQFMLNGKLTKQFGTKGNQPVNRSFGKLYLFR